jgi:type II secretory pathway component GspD/PulD (secretin)
MMTLSTVVRSACCLLLLSASASAQNPFGGQDPFVDGGKKAPTNQGSDPFGGGGSDPFGGGGGGDPFGVGGGGGDPFAARGNGRGADPFGGGSADHANPFEQKAKPATRKRDPIQQPSLPSSHSADHIRGVLGDKTTQNFVELPLQDVIQQLSQAHDIPIVIDARSLDELGISADSPVNLTLKNISLRSCLRIALRQYDLTYIIKDEVLQITTPETADRCLVVQTYRFPDALVEKSDQVLRALLSTVRPDQWDDKGGPCSAAVVDNVLVISATETGHEAVIDFMEKLQAALR